MSKRIIKFSPRSAPAPLVCGRIEPRSGTAEGLGGRCFASLQHLTEELHEGNIYALVLTGRFSAPDALAITSGKPVKVAQKLLRAGVKRVDAAAFGLRGENERAVALLRKAGAKPVRGGLLFGGAFIDWL